MKLRMILAGLILVGSCWATDATTFKPGELWPDDKGVHVNAHGGGLLLHEGLYYWFGEHKIAGSAGNRAHVGVHVYASKDLYNWSDRGIALKAEDDPKSEITKGCVLERPKVIFNRKTGKFVMWFHLEHKGQGYSSARSAVAIADTVTGPYTFLHSPRGTLTVWPLNFPDEQKNNFEKSEAYFSGPASDDEKREAHRAGLAVNASFREGQMSRDQTVFVDDDETAYHIASSEHNATLHIRELDASYTAYSGKYIRIFPGRYHEAPAMFKRGGKYYMITSGCSGWRPNAARSMVADEMLGEWTELGNPCLGVNSANNYGPEKTFGGQSTFVLPIQGKEDAYIAMFDIWRPKDAIDGRYVWLPIEFTENGFTVRWQSEWDLSVFD